MNKIIITGSRGFIGKRLVESMSSSYLNVIGINRMDGNVTDPKLWEKLPDCECIIHLAGQNFVPDSWKHSNQFLETNIIGTNLGLEYAKKVGARFVYVSSYLYGKPNYLPIGENHPIVPNNPYALSKHLTEQVCKFRSDHFQQDVTILRIFNVYGPGQREEFLIPSIIKQFKEKKEIKLLDLRPKRDFVYIDDVITAIESAVNGRKGYSVYNIGSGVSYSVEEVIEMCQRILKINYPVNSEGIERVQEIPDVVADITKVYQELGWTPKVSMVEGLNKLLMDTKLK